MLTRACSVFVKVTAMAMLVITAVGGRMRRGQRKQGLGPGARPPPLEGAPSARAGRAVVTAGVVEPVAAETAARTPRVEPQAARPAVRTPRGHRRRSQYGSDGSLPCRHPSPSRAHDRVLGPRHRGFIHALRTGLPRVCLQIRTRIAPSRTWPTVCPHCSREPAPTLRRR